MSKGFRKETVSALLFHSIHKIHGKFEQPMLKWHPSHIHHLSRKRIDGEELKGSRTLPIEQVKTPTPLVHQQVKTFLLHDAKINITGVASIWNQKF